MDKYDFEKRRLLENLKKYINVPYLLVLAAVAISGLLQSETRTIETFVAFTAVYAVKKYDSRIPAGFALSLLVLAAFAFVSKSEELADRIAMYSYYYLLAGVVLHSIEYLRDPGDKHEE